jgi:hypothetical protein
MIYYEFSATLAAPTTTTQGRLGGRCDRRLSAPARSPDVWDPAAGQGALVAALAEHGFRSCATADDFMRYAAPPGRVDAIVSNPPYGPAGRLAAAFVRKALTFDVRLVAMLLRIDFDSGKTRADLFRDNPRFAGKLVLLDRERVDSVLFHRVIDQELGRSRR